MSKPVRRLGDHRKHTGCCGCSTWRDSVKSCLDCSRMVKRGSRCPEHQREHARMKAAQFGTGWSWRRTREAVIARDGGCVLAPPHDGPLEVDHVKPRANGGTNEMTNLRTLCRLHNRGRKA